MAIFKILVLLLSLCCLCQAQLSPTFYNQTCRSAFRTIQNILGFQLFREPRLAAALIRLHFLDCFVHGCDGSILLNEFTEDSERDASINSQLARAFQVINDVKTYGAEDVCPGVISCADILAFAAKEATRFLGGPRYEVKYGRRDSTAAYRALAETDLPKFNASLDELTALFLQKGLNTTDLVALSGLLPRKHNFRFSHYI